MNNYERIKQMSVDEMALLLNCECCIYNDGDTDCDGVDCQNAVKEWLLQECEFWEKELDRKHLLMLEKYKQTLTEIKEIVQNRLSLVCKDCVLKQCKTCEAKQILQKCEVINANIQP